MLDVFCFKRSYEAPCRMTCKFVIATDHALVISSLKDDIGYIMVTLVKEGAIGFREAP